MQFMEQFDYCLFSEDSGGDRPTILLHGSGGNHLS
jgi:hypothetical protein